MFNKEEFLKFIVENRVVGFFEQPIKLKSGRLSHWYVNWRTITEDVFLSDKLTDFIIDFVESKKIHVDTYFGVPEGATKIGILCQYKHAKKQTGFAKGSHALAMGRGKVKEHGEPKDRYFLGIPKGKTVVIEDVTTTGGSLIETVGKLKEANVDIACAIGLTNRMEKRDDGKSVEEALREIGINYYAMSEATELLPRIAKSLKISEETKKNVIEYFKKYGTKEVIF
ncbi:MAG: hypothetical protein QXF35_04250 [Candidatus Bilamarchaeaceae archaeon]